MHRQLSPSSPSSDGFTCFQGPLFDSVNTDRLSQYSWTIPSAVVNPSAISKTELGRRLSSFRPVVSATAVVTAAAATFKIGP